MVMLVPRRRTDVYSAAFPPTVKSVPEARHFLCDAIAPRLAPEALDVALLLVSELATNAVMHAATPFVVDVRMAPSSLRISVADGDDHTPTVAERDRATPGGFGLYLVEQLAARWGIDATDQGEHGKEVWFELEL